jgi:hypothetical protein
MPAGVDLEIGVAHGGRRDSHDRLAPAGDRRGPREKLEAPRSLEHGRDHRRTDVPIALARLTSLR